MGKKRVPRISDSIVKILKVPAFKSSSSKYKKWEISTAGGIIAGIVASLLGKKVIDKSKKIENIGPLGKTTIELESEDSGEHEETTGESSSELSEPDIKELEASAETDTEKKEE